MKVTWYPANGDLPIIFDDGTNPNNPYKLSICDGVSSTLSSPLTNKSPGQQGTTLQDNDVNQRVITIGTFFQAPTHAAHLALRQRLSRAMAVGPRRPGQPAQAGLLVFDRDPLLPLVRTVATPQDSPRYQTNMAFEEDALCEFVCPMPWFESVQEYTFTISTGGGFTFPMTFPLVMISANTREIVEIASDVWNPWTARIYGDVDAPKLVNASTGERLELTGNVPTGHHLAITTEWGQKKIELVFPDGTRQNAMNRLNVGTSRFWEMRPSDNEIVFEASALNGGFVMFTYRRRYAGI